MQHEIAESIFQNTRFVFACGEIAPHIVYGLRPNNVRGLVTDVRQAAHLLLFVARLAAFPENGATAQRFTT